MACDNEFPLSNIHDRFSCELYNPNSTCKGEIIPKELICNAHTLTKFHLWIHNKWNLDSIVELYGNNLSNMRQPKHKSQFKAHENSIFN